MDIKRKNQIIITQTNEACTSMIGGIRHLRLSVLDIFKTLADMGTDPEKNFQHHNQTSNPTSRLHKQQTILAIANSHSLCTASNPQPKVQKQLEQQQNTDLIQYVDQMISSISSTLRSLDQDISVLMNNSSVISMGEAVHLGMDSSLDKHNLFMDLCSSYKNLTKLHDYSTHCHALLHQQSLKRVHKRNDAFTASNQLTLSQQQANQSSLAAARSESLVATFNPYIYKICMSKQSITSMLDVYLKQCEHIEGTYSQPFGLSTGVLQVSVNRVLKAILIMRGIMIDAVIVKAYHESFSSKASKVGSSASLLTASGICASAQTVNSGGVQFVDPETDGIDLWSESKYNVFRRLTHHANAAVLHFQYPTYPEIAVRSFLVSIMTSLKCNSSVNLLMKSRTTVTHLI